MNTKMLLAGALLMAAPLLRASDRTENTPSEAVRLKMDTDRTEELSPFIFGHNLEHTRAAVNGGLSAEMLRNRKFAGKPSKNQGVASDWFGIGAKTFFYQDKSYTEHICLSDMHRRNELNSQGIQNFTAGSAAGIGQYDITVEKGRKYSLRCVTKVTVPLSLKVDLGDREGGRLYASAVLKLTPSEEWVTSGFEFVPSESDAGACIRYSFTEVGGLTIGALSMMPADNFNGMRRDVVDNLREIGPSILRWPGGNFAGEYRWKDGLLPSDRRGPLGAATEIETQPYTAGFDFHEINTDDFVALCREVGAEPFITINAVWSTPEESAQWVEYCNGPADSEYGRKRAERGHAEPYNVKYWSLGNEMGYGHMEGPKGPEAYASMVRKHASAMMEKDSGLKLFSSGPYPNDNWARHSAAALSDLAPYVSLHNYSGPSGWSGAGYEYTTEEGVRRTYNGIINSVKSFFDLAGRMRTSLDKTGSTMHISFDEWNQWYSWYRPSCVGEGIFTARFIHNMIAASGPLDIPVCCYFQPVGEGAILITPAGSRLTANGQVFSLMKAHTGGRLCRMEGDAGDAAVATLKDGVLTVTIVNDSYDREKSFVLEAGGKLQDAVLLSSTDVRPYTFFDESALDVEVHGRNMSVCLPPHSVASLTVMLRRK